MVGDERPSFSVATGEKEPPVLPWAAWTLSVFAVAAAFAGTFRGQVEVWESCRQSSLFCPSVDLAAWPAFAGPFLAAGALLLLVPTSRGPAGATRAAGFLAVLGGVSLLAQAVASASGGVEVPVGLLPLALGAPLAMVGVTNPAARFGPASLRSPAGWLRAGSMFVAAGAAGATVGYWPVAATDLGSIALGGGALAGAERAWVLAGVLLVIAGAVALRSVVRPAAPPDAPPRRRRLGLTAMLGYAVLAESGITVSGAACLTALTGVAWSVGDAQSALLSASVGAFSGAALAAALAPRIDQVAGRGRLLSMAYVAPVVAPLAVAAYVGDQSLAWLALASATFAFAGSLAPPRYAIVFDLCPSHTRLRSSLDFHALRLASGAAGVSLVLMAGGATDALGLALASAYGVLGLATFVMTLGSLGRRH